MKDNRLVWRVALAVSVVAVLATALVLSHSEPSPVDVVRALAPATSESLPPTTEPPVSSTTAPPASSTTATAPAKATTTSPVIITSSTWITAPTTTTTTVACQNSHDPRCGPFRWDREPENRPMTARLAVLTPSPTAGRPVEFELVVEDDARISRNCYDGGFGEETRTCHADCAFSRAGYGPWSPPDPEPDRYETVLSHTYERPGTYQVHFTYRSGDTCSRPSSPYASTGTATVDVTIEDLATPGGGASAI